MSQPSIILPRTTRLNRMVLGDCLWKLRTFVERDAYVEFDYGGGLANPTGDVITEAHVHAMNCALRARSPNASWSRFVGRPLPELAEIPEALDLAEGGDAEIRAGYDALGRLARRLLSQSGLTDVSVSNVLHLCRPNFVAILGPYVKKCLGIDESGTGTTSDRIDTFMAVQRGIWGLARSNKEALDELAAYAATLPPIQPSSGKFSGQVIPVLLSKSRILDIILWSDVAIHDERQSAWTRWYNVEVIN